MIIRSIAVNQFRKFDRPTKIEDLTEGINIVAGPNEMGKSTLLAALRAAFFGKHTSKANAIREFQHTQNKAAPVVNVQFEIDGKDFTIQKRFIKKPYANLQLADGRLIEGDAAEEELLKLLNHSSNLKGPSVSGTPGMWKVFWVEQGRSFTAIDLSDDERSSLQIAMEMEVGEVLGGTRGRELPKRFETQRSKHVTAKNRQPTGHYKYLIEQIEELNGEVSDLNENQQELSAHLDGLESAERRLAEISSTAQDDADREKLQEAETRLKYLDGLSEKREVVQREIERIAVDLERFQRDADELDRLAKAIEAENRSIRSVKDQLAVIRDRVSVANQGRDLLQEEAKKLKNEFSEFEGQLDDARRKQTAIQLHNQLKDLENRLQEFRNAEIRIRENERKSAEILVTENSIESIRVAAHDLAVAQANATASSTRVRFELDRNAHQDITVDGDILPSEQHEIETIEELAIEIPRLGTITVMPAIDQQVKLSEDRQRANSRLTDELRVVGAESVEHAERMHVRRQTLLQSVESAREDLERFARASAIDSTDTAAYENQIADVEARLKVELKSLKIDDISEISVELLATDEIQKRMAERSEYLLHIEERIESDRVAREEQRIELTRLETEEQHHLSQKISLETQLAITREQGSESDLEVQIGQAKGRMAQQSNLLADLDNRISDDERDMVVSRIERLENSIRNREQRRVDLKVEIARLSATIENMEGVGIQEKIQLKVNELDFVTAEKDRIEREVAVLNLLLAILSEAEEEARDMFLSPVLKRIRPYLITLFPNAELNMDEQFNIVDVVRGQGFEESFQSLSMGTQEQIAVLTRIAFAEMLADKGYPAVVVLDDALVFSDDTRMDLMFDILNAASKNIQIIILTCRAKLFEGFSETLHQLKPADKEELLSA